MLSSDQHMLRSARKPISWFDHVDSAAFLRYNV